MAETTPVEMTIALGGRGGILEPNRTADREPVLVVPAPPLPREPVLSDVLPPCQRTGCHEAGSDSR